jgi:hypothetical protein
MTWHGDLRLMLIGLYPSKDPVTYFAGPRPCRSSCIPGAWALTFLRMISQGCDKTL